MFRTSGHTYRITLEAWQHSRTLLKVVRACTFTVAASYHNPLTMVLVLVLVGVRACCSRVVHDVLLLTLMMRCRQVVPDMLTGTNLFSKDA